MIRFFFIISLLFSCSFSIFSQKKEIGFEGEWGRCTYESQLGRFNGKYISYYKNGQRRAKGYFETNYRVGEWTVWDSTGQMLVKRLYESPFVFKQLYPKLPKDELIDLLSSPRYIIEYDNNGVIKKFDLKPRMVEWQERVYRLLLSEENPLLFEGNRLFKALNELIQKEGIIVYSDEYLEEKLNFTPQLQNFLHSEIEILGFKWKEDYIYDNDRYIMEAFPVAICPVALDAQHDTSSLYCMYYPQIRNHLAHISVTNEKGKPIDKVTTIDELFFYRNFYGEIYRVSNGENQTIKKYKSSKDIVNEAQLIEIFIIEGEHDNWIRTR